MKDVLEKLRRAPCPCGCGQTVGDCAYRRESEAEPLPDCYEPDQEEQAHRSGI